MNTDPQAQYGASHGTHYDGQTGVTGAVVLALVLAGLLVAVSYPVVALAVVAGALVPTAVRTASARLANLRTPSPAPGVTVDARQPPRELSD